MRRRESTFGRHQWRIRCGTSPHHLDSRAVDLRSLRRRTRGQPESGGCHDELKRPTGCTLVLLTRTQAECVRVAQLFADRKVQKTYLCRSALYPQRRSQKSWVVDLALGQRKGRVWIDPQGQSALTKFRHLGQGWIEAKPHTGRKHQIRVHLAQAGWPIDGDELYRGRPFHRMMLHAWKLELDHPAKGPLQLRSELGPEFELSV